MKDESFIQYIERMKECTTNWAEVEFNVLREDIKNMHQSYSDLMQKFRDSQQEIDYWKQMYRSTQHICG